MPSTCVRWLATTQTACGRVARSADTKEATIGILQKQLWKQSRRNYVLCGPWHLLLGLLTKTFQWPGVWERGLILDPQRGWGYYFRSVEATTQGVMGRSLVVKVAHRTDRGLGSGCGFHFCHAPQLLVSSCRSLVTAGPLSGLATLIMPWNQHSWLWIFSTSEVSPARYCCALNRIHMKFFSNQLYGCFIPSAMNFFHVIILCASKMFVKHGVDQIQ